MVGVDVDTGVDAAMAELLFPFTAADAVAAESGAEESGGDKGEEGRPEVE